MTATAPSASLATGCGHPHRYHRRRYL